MRIGAAAAAAFAFLWALGAHAEQVKTPGWMHVDAGNKRVTIDMVAGWNPNNGALNFNGFYKGDATVVIPVGWSVKVNFLNHDGMLPHSLLVSKRYPPDAIPAQSGVNQVAISRAYTRDPESGLAPADHDDFSFTAKEPGEYWLLCGVPGHGIQGMYINLTIDAKAAQPGTIIEEGAEAGRP